MILLEFLLFWGESDEPAYRPIVEYFWDSNAGTTQEANKVNNVGVSSSEAANIFKDLGESL